MRFAPDGHALAFTAGYGGGGLSIQIVAVGPWTTTAVLPAGHDPRWIGSRHLIARSPDGLAGTATVNGYVCDYVGANDDDLDAAGGRTAYAPDRSQGVRVYASGVQVETFPGTFEPGLSSGGTIALRDLASGAYRLVRLVGCVDASARDPNLGPGTRPRWSSQSIVIDTVPFGRVLGRSSPDQPTVDLSVPDRATTHPVVLWTGARLFVGVVLDDGLLVVADWGALLNQERRGWIVGESGGSAFDWDLVVAPWSASTVVIAYLMPDGALATHTLDTATAPLDDLSVAPPQPEPGPDPPDPPQPEPGPEPPDPPVPGPDPPTPTPPTPEDDMQVVRYDEWRNMEMRLEDTYCNHGGHPPRQITTHVNAEGEVWRQHYAERRNPGDMTHEQAIRSIESEIDVIEGRPDRWAGSSSGGGGGEPVAPGVLRGPIGTDRRWFTVPD